MVGYIMITRFVYSYPMLIQILAIIYVQKCSSNVVASKVGLSVTSNLIIEPMVDRRFIVIEKHMNLLDIIGPHIQCGMLCGKDCLIFEVKERSCRLYIKFIGTSSSSSTPIIWSRFKIFAKGQVPSSLWPRPEVLIFRLKSLDGSFWPREVVPLNKDDPRGAKYSILDDMDEFTASDGHFHFKLCYPGLSNVSCYRWSQSENPMTLTGQVIPKDFVYKEGPFPQDSRFKGLSRSTPAYCLLDADLKESNTWHFAIGAYKSHGGLDTFPGPRESNVDLVELFLEM